MGVLIASAKFWSARGSSCQPAFKSSSLTISHTCLPCLLGGRTLLFWSDLLVFWRVVSRERWESSQLARWEKCMSVVRWKGGKGGRIMSKRWESSELARRKRWESNEVARRKVPVFFSKGGGQRVSPRFHLFVSDVNQQKEVAGCVQDILAWRKGWKDSL